MYACKGWFVFTLLMLTPEYSGTHDDVIKWKHFPRYWPFVWGIHRSPFNSPHKGQWRGALIFSLICARINGWVNNREAGDVRRHCAHYDVIVLKIAAYTKDSYGAKPLTCHVRSRTGNKWKPFNTFGQHLINTQHLLSVNKMFIKMC